MIKTDLDGEALGSDPISVLAFVRGAAERVLKVLNLHESRLFGVLADEHFLHYRCTAVQARRIARKAVCIEVSSTNRVEEIIR